MKKKFTMIMLCMIAGIYAMSPAASTPRPAPEIDSKTWINSDPLNIGQLKDKVVMVEFWTFGCYNCRNVEPYIKKWHERYHDKGLTIIGVHSPEFDRERDLDNVRRYVKEHQIKYSVAIDNDFVIWNRFNNRYWPALYLIDKQGNIRYTHIGEGGYTKTEQWINRLLSESTP